MYHLKIICCSKKHIQRAKVAYMCVVPLKRPNISVSTTVYDILEMVDSVYVAVQLYLTECDD